MGQDTCRAYCCNSLTVIGGMWAIFNSVCQRHIPIIAIWAYEVTHQKANVVSGSHCSTETLSGTDKNRP